MSIGLLAMLVGVFGVPLLLLWSGHRLRRRSERWRAAFWGGLSGHVVAMILGTYASMSPAAAWGSTDTMRGTLGFWSWAVLPLFGALVGGLVTGRRTS